MNILKITQLFEAQAPVRGQIIIDTKRVEIRLSLDPEDCRKVGDVHYVRNEWPLDSCLSSIDWTRQAEKMIDVRAHELKEAVKSLPNR